MNYTCTTFFWIVTLNLFLGLFFLIASSATMAWIVGTAENNETGQTNSKAKDTTNRELALHL